MQIEKYFVGYCPLLVDSDILSVAPALVLRGERIYDTTVGAMHCVQAPGGQILQKLSRGASLSELKKFCGQKDTSPENLYDILGFCNLTGCLERKRSLAGHLSAYRKLLIGLLMGIRYKPLSKRITASPGSIALQLIATSQPIIWATIIVMLLAGSGRVLPLDKIIAWGASWLLAFLVTTYAHELAHYIVIKTEQLPVDTIRHHLRFALLHRPLDPHMELISALSGPITGLALCVLGIAWGIINNLSFIYINFAAASFMHLGSILPWYGDGASIKAAWQQRTSE